MYRLTEDVARKIIKNVKSPEIGPLDLAHADPFKPKNTKSVGFIDCYCCIGSDFDYLLEFPYPFINSQLPPLPGLDGYWLYKRSELLQPMEPFSVPRYLADPNIQGLDEYLDVADCSIVLPSEVEKLTCVSIMTFEKLLEREPLLLDCLNEDLK